MSWNPVKCYAMELELAEGEQSRERPRLQLDGQVLQYKAQLKYLGVTLSERQLLTQQPVAECSKFAGASTRPAFCRTLCAVCRHGWPSP